ARRSGATAAALAPRGRCLEATASLSRLRPSGGVVALVADGGRARTNGTFSLLSPAYGTSLGRELRQPLLRDRAIDPVRRRILVAHSERDRSRAGLRRTVADMLAATEVSYWGLTAAQRAVEVRAAAVALAEQQLDE